MECETGKQVAGMAYIVGNAMTSVSLWKGTVSEVATIPARWQPRLDVYVSLVPVSLG